MKFMSKAGMRVALGLGVLALVSVAIGQDKPATQPSSTAPAASTQASRDWPSWRGPNRDGVSLETGMNWDWPKDGPAVAWKAAIGPGYASVIVRAGKVFTTGKNIGAEDKKLTALDAVWCVDAQNGVVLWHTPLPLYEEKYYTTYDVGSCSTPATDDKAVYALSNRGGAAALDIATGKVLWEHDISKDPAIAGPGYYWGASPLVVGNVVIHNGGLSGIALDKATGKTVWQSGTAGTAHISPVICQVDGKAAAVVISGTTVSVVDVADGTVMYSLVRKWPLSSPNYTDPIIVGSGMEWAGALLKFENKTITTEGPADKRNAYGIGSSFCMPILWKGCVYAAHFTPRSSKDPGVNSKLIDFTYRCRDVATGAIKWEKENMSGTQMLVDGKIVLLGIDGTLTVFEASPEAYKEVAKAQIFPGYEDGKQGTHCVSAPAFADGRIYCRKGGQLLCIDVRKK
jgi:outer membrane protein assembly factor BamB